jgi:rubrerythrin
MAEEQDKTSAALKFAIQMEIDGKEFYLRASQASTNKLGKKLLETLAGEEDLHRRIFESIYENIRSKKAWPRTDFKSDGGRGLRTVFARALEEMEDDVKAIPTELEAIKTAMAMENKTYDYYKEQSQKATFDAEKEFYDALVIQEGEHHRILLDYYEFLKNPAAWFTQKEHPSLDGG